MGGIAQGIGTLGAGIAQAGAITSAAHTQADAAKYAADQGYKAANQANQLQRDQFATQQANTAPWLQAGQTSLGYLMGGEAKGEFNPETAPSGYYGQNQWSGVDPYYSGAYQAFGGNTQYGGPSQVTGTTQFAAPAPFTDNTQFHFDGSDLENDPGFQFQLDQGRQALLASQSATGISGGAAAKALERYAQDYAGTAYSNAYQRAQGTFNQNLQNASSQHQQNFDNSLATFAGNYDRSAQQQQQNIQNGLAVFGQNYDRAAQQNQQNFQDSFNASQANIANAEASYQNSFNRGLAEQQNNYNVGQQNQTTNFNRLATLAGIGQTANAQLGQAGAQYAANAGGNLIGAAAQAGNYGTQAANANALYRQATGAQMPYQAPVGVNYQIPGI